MRKKKFINFPSEKIYFMSGYAKTHVIVFFPNFYRKILKKIDNLAGVLYISS